MTLIVGIILDNGILMMSDSRERLENSFNIKCENKRKITIVTPNMILGTAGSEVTFHTARILRQSLYNNFENLTADDCRKSILDLYSHVNLLYSLNHPQKLPIGDILIGEYDNLTNNFSLLSVDEINGFTKFTTHNQKQDVLIIGADDNLRRTAKSQVKKIVNEFTKDSIQTSDTHFYIAKKCQEIYKNLATTYMGINDNLYCVHLSTFNNKVTCSTYFLENNENIYNIPLSQDGEIIDLKKTFLI
ncbi:Ntn hydrolase family protein [Bacillus thuringiensis]|uniref:hypothetical protein n=1 Tax=Bacillus thuringiensis TaxID=1428 RepID=UPI002225ED58|nr:hypothetical protein [Bacillus thuringiensis]